MAFFLEYVALNNIIGRAAVQATTADEALRRAAQALLGMDCETAVLRYAVERRGTRGEGAAIARYTRARGWENAETSP
ncbi:hypothetical protein [Pseudarthrobacter sulfonivorans]|uniref:hypothetical protein n=2 Tax=Pseudarthrobacter TaxID=1742993 RepID=UPI00278AE6C5|nr:hypothetical protein [Pseudarthrobacter sulfonivorans]MDQ0000645.1 hypothetical protein [Pseudarthrobacter sulfonivorans]